MLRKLSLLPYLIRTITGYSYGRRLTHARRYSYIPALCLSSFMPNLTQTTPNPNLSPSSALAVPLPEAAAIVLTEMTEMQVAANAQTRCRIPRLWNYEYGCRSCGQFVCRRPRKKLIHRVENISLCRVRGGKSLITSLELGEKSFDEQMLTFFFEQFCQTTGKVTRLKP